MKKTTCALWMAAVLPAICGAAAINYQGTVSAGGTPFTGTGYFKFQILDGRGVVVWSHDGSPPGGPPAGHVAVPVNCGLFHVALGDAGAGMTPIPGAILHRPPIWLRTWFSTNPASFQLLSPDVNLQVPDLSFFDTGNLLVVDDDPGSDFSSLAAAFAHVATNSDVSALLVMPGYYALAGPLVMPSNRWMVICGMDASAVTIENTNGPALVFGQGVLRGVTVRGNPAATDLNSPINVIVRVADCQFERVSGNGPAVDLCVSNTLVECRSTMFTATGGPAARVAAGATLDAFEPVFNTWMGAGAGLLVADGGACEIREARFWTSRGRAVAATGQLGYKVDIHQSRMEGGIALSNCAGKVNLYQCQVYCDTNRGAAVEVVGGGANNDGIALNECSVDCVGVPAAFARASAGERVWMEFHGCRVIAINLPIGSAGIVVTNASGNVDSAQLDLFGTRLSADSSEGGSWAIRSDGARVVCYGSQVNGDGGLLAKAGSEVSLNRSEVDGKTVGVRLTGGSSLDADFAQISAEDGVGVEAVGDAEAVLLQSWVEGDGAAGVGARGVAAGGRLPTLFMIGANAMGEYRALDFEDGTLVAANSLFATEAGLAVRIARVTAAPRVQMNHCQMIRLEPAAAPAAVLAGSPAPAPAFAHCAFHAPGAAASIGLDGVAGAVISLVNSTLSTNLAAGIVVKPATSLGNGNFVP